MKAREMTPQRKMDGFQAVRLSTSRAQLRIVWKLYPDEEVRAAAKEKAEQLTPDGNEPELISFT